MVSSAFVALGFMAVSGASAKADTAQRQRPLVRRHEHVASLTQTDASIDDPDPFDVITEDRFLERCDFQWYMRMRQDKPEYILANVKEGSLVCVQGNYMGCPQQGGETPSIDDFNRTVFSKLKVGIRMATLQSDCEQPPTANRNRLHELLNDPKLLSWWAWNFVGDPAKYPKMHHLPLGLNEQRHSSIREAFKSLQHRRKRKKLKRVFVNFNVASNSDKRQALWEMSANWSFADRYAYPLNQSLDLYSTMGKYKFMVSPEGAGPDTHRFWEALYLGIVPIVLSGPMDPMYGTLPVVKLSKWEDLPKIFDTIKDSDNYTMRPTSLKHLHPELTLNYWVSKVREV